MPLYIIKCKECSHTEEKLFSSSDTFEQIAKIYQCKCCGKIGKWKKLPAPSNFIMK